MKQFLMQVLAQAPMILVAAIFAAIGWSRLQQSHRRAAWWLLAGTAGLLLHVIFNALHFVTIMNLNVGLRRGETDIESVSWLVGLAGITSTLLLVLSIAGIAISAISSRGSVEPRGAA